MHSNTQNTKPPLSAATEMGGCVLVAAPALSPGEHKVFWLTRSLRFAATPLAGLKNKRCPVKSEHRSFSLVNQSCQTDAVNQ